MAPLKSILEQILQVSSCSHAHPSVEADLADLPCICLCMSSWVQICTRLWHSQSQPVSCVRSPAQEGGDYSNKRRNCICARCRPATRLPSRSFAHVAPVACIACHLTCTLHVVHAVNGRATDLHLVSGAAVPQPHNTRSLPTLVGSTCMCCMAIADWLYEDYLTKVCKQRDINQIDLMALMWQLPSLARNCLFCFAYSAGCSHR